MTRSNDPVNPILFAVPGRLMDKQGRYIYSATPALYAPDAFRREFPEKYAELEKLLPVEVQHEQGTLPTFEISHPGDMQIGRIYAFDKPGLQYLKLSDGRVQYRMQRGSTTYTKWMPADLTEEQVIKQVTCHLGFAGQEYLKEIYPESRQVFRSGYGWYLYGNEPMRAILK